MMSATRYPRSYFFQKFQPLACHTRLQIREAGYVLTWMGQALHKPLNDRLADGSEDNGYAASGLLRCPHCRDRIGEDEVRRKTQQFRNRGFRLVGAGVAPSIIDQ